MNKKKTKYEVMSDAHRMIKWWPLDGPNWEDNPSLTNGGGVNPFPYREKLRLCMVAAHKKEFNLKELFSKIYPLHNRAMISIEEQYEAGKITIHDLDYLRKLITFRVVERFVKRLN